MNTKSKDIQNQFQGYKKTPLLWKDNTVFGLQQFEIPKKNTTVFNEQLHDKLRLGKRVERFVSHELKQHNEIAILLENYQVQEGKRTIGELDCIIKQDDVPIHLEIIYKFYLYDNRVGTTEIEHWIGPNRNDTLLKKLTKLKKKQLPLLYSEYTKPILEGLHLITQNIKQRVYFKAQLFIPYNMALPKFTLLNKNCLVGFYIRHKEIEQFSNCKFFIPTKLNWLADIEIHVNWLDFELFSERITTMVAEKKAPLCWIKFPNGTVDKFFVVWWE